MANKILVIDFGSQYNQLIVRRIRDFGIFSELVPNTIDINEIRHDSDVKGIIFSGGPNSVYEQGAPTIGPAIYKLGIPILGICYGMQLMTYQNQGKVKASRKKEYGSTQMTMKSCKLTNGLDSKQLV
jgi:GMP synthase (glutamine-hydrolysing)